MAIFGRFTVMHDGPKLKKKVEYQWNIDQLKKIKENPLRTDHSDSLGPNYIPFGLLIEGFMIVYNLAVIVGLFVGCFQSKSLSRWERNNVLLKSCFMYFCNL